jgi:hypothetical protein
MQFGLRATSNLMPNVRSVGAIPGRPESATQPADIYGKIQRKYIRLSLWAISLAGGGVSIQAIPRIERNQQERGMKSSIRYAVLFALAICFVAIAGLYAIGWRAHMVAFHMSGPLYSAPASTAPQADGAGYHYRAPPSRAKALIDNLPKIALGMSRADLRTHLGMPDREYALGRVGILPALTEIDGAAMVYIVEAETPAGIGPKDQTIEFLFDKGDRLRRIIRKSF